MFPLLLLMLQAPPADIVVTGKRLVEAQAACVRGECTPLRDAQASIALAEAQFRDGRYMDARRLLAAAVSRNRGHAATDPKPVAALYEAYATVALHEGDQAIYRRAVAGQVNTLRTYLPATDPAAVAAIPVLGDMWAKLGDYRKADAAYRAAERNAADAGLEGAALLAAVKRVWLKLAAGYRTEAVRMLDAIAARPAAAAPRMRDVLQVMRLRIAARDADDTEMNRLAATLGRGQGPVPSLLWSPPLPRDPAAAANSDARRFGGPDVVQMMASDIAGIQWIDLGYWIRPDGRTAEVEILRGSKSHPWADTIVRQAEGRRYTAMTSDAAAPDIAGLYRIERVTLRSKYMTPKGSLIRRRVRADGFEILDLTGAEAPAP